jgi:putative Holliday junction resolvase
MGRALALDVGTKTIGVATTDPLRIITQPVITLKRKGVRQDVEALRKHVEELRPDIIVVGLPLELHGGEERSAKLARQIGDAVAASLGVPVVYHDERFTSVEAERRLIAQDVSRARRKEVIDQVAAMVILESWLESLGR